MPFIEEEERIIIMDINRATYFGGDDYSLSAAEMAQLREVGIRTILQQMWWSQIEKEPGKRDWTPVEVSLERAEKAGVKVLLGCYQMAPPDLDPAWYQIRPNGTVMQHFSIWNKEANAYEEQFVRELADRFAGPNVLIQNTLISDGECLFHPNGSWHDPAGLESFRETCGDIPPTIANADNGWLLDSIIAKFKQYQGLLLEVQEHDELWTQLHPMIQGIGAGTQYMPQLFTAMRNWWPNVALFWLLYTFCEFPPGWQVRQVDLAKKHNVNLVHGAMHIAGLKHSVPVAKANGLRLLCGPRHDNILPDVHEISPDALEKLGVAVKELS